VLTLSAKAGIRQKEKPRRMAGVSQSKESAGFEDAQVLSLAPKLNAYVSWITESSTCIPA
jgi:hypothetical protein